MFYRATKILIEELVDIHTILDQWSIIDEDAVHNAQVSHTCCKVLITDNEKIRDYYHVREI